MENENLLEQVIEDRLNTALDNEVDVKVRSQAHKEAMEAIDRQIQLKKLAASEEETKSKQNVEYARLAASKEETNSKQNVEYARLALERSEKKSNRIIKVVEIAAIPVGLFVADCLFKRYYMRQVCNFEKDYSFTTTPGKGISSLFRFKH